METISKSQIHELLAEVARRHKEPGELILLGGSALRLLGSHRPTFDVDYVGHDLYKDALQQVIEDVAQEMGIEVEAVPINEFIPSPTNAHHRQIPIGTYGRLNVFVLDPHSIALSKIDRGFDSDIEDVLFLIHQGFISLIELESIVSDAAASASQFDLNPVTMEEHLNDVRNQL